jgi:hypothetical protein
MGFTGREEVRINLDSLNTSVEPATEDMDYTITQQAFFFFFFYVEQKSYLNLLAFNSLI